MFKLNNFFATSFAEVESLRENKSRSQTSEIRAWARVGRSCSTASKRKVTQPQKQRGLLWRRKPRGCLTAMRFHQRQLEIAHPHRKGKSKKTAGCL